MVESAGGGAGFVDSDVPKYGWKVKLNHQFREKRNPNNRPRLRQIPQFVSLAIRYVPWYLNLRWKHIMPIMDGIKPLTLKQIYGVPLGGIGCGTIGRGFRGEFCRFQLFAGYYQHHVVKSDTFIVCVRKNGKTIYQQVLSPKKPKKTLSAWKWGFPAEDADYTGLYPRSWTVYHLKPVGIILVCRQLSPVIPHDYKDSCLPLATFSWKAINNTSEDVDVSIMFTFKNGTGSRKDANGGRWNESFAVKDGSTAVHGVMMHQTVKNCSCTTAISALESEGVSVSHAVSFNPRGTGEDLWEDLWADGRLDNSKDVTEKTVKGKEIACALCSSVSVPPNERRQLDFCLAWDMPVVTFRKAPSISYLKRYTRWFGADEKGCPKLACYAFQNANSWTAKIEEWQKRVLDDSSLPDWYKAAIFNELYFVSDGGGIWIENTESKSDSITYSGDVRPEYGKFAYLEGHEYRMFNTYDVHFYASFAMIKLWPKLQLSIQYDYAEYIQSEDTRSHFYLMSGHRAPRKTRMSVPHDVGDPEESPWEAINAYCIEDTNNWKDLNLKFILQVYRDYLCTKDGDYLQNMFPITQALVNKCLVWDRDGDGLIENSGTADQTFDTWFMTGPRQVYVKATAATKMIGQLCQLCTGKMVNLFTVRLLTQLPDHLCGLWLASLFVMSKMARQLGLTDEANKYEEVFEKGQRSFQDKLWNGKYYNFDCSSNSWFNSIMADQLCGHWYLRACGHAYEVFPRENVLSALQTIYQFNVKGVHDGKMGAVNGMRPDGARELCTFQAEEIWTGVTYALASTMIYEGLKKEGLSTAEGLYRTLYDQLGMAYQTPEALLPEKHYRSLGYMRPLSIWSIQMALDAANECATASD